MPFQSEKQRRYMHANHPTIAKRWEIKYNEGGSVYIGSAIKTEYGGNKLSNKSYERYYKGMI